MTLLFSKASNLNRWGTTATANTTVRNSRAKRNRASHTAIAKPVVLWNYSRNRYTSTGKQNFLQ